MKITRYRNWKIQSKIMSLSLISVLFVTALTLFYLLPFMERKVMDGKKSATQDVVAVAYGIMAAYDGRAKAGEMTVEEAQARAMRTIKNLRYHDKEYFWINDLTPRMIMHPTKPELDGKDLSGNRDPNGKCLFVEFTRVSKEAGGGFVDYMWPKPGESQPVPKVSYVQLYRPWGWIVGSGIYVDDVKAEMAALRWKIVTGTVLFALLLFALAFSTGCGISRSLRSVIDSLEEIAHGEGDLTRRIRGVRQDESGKLAGAFNIFVEKLQGIICEVTDNALRVASAAGQLQAASEQMAGGVDKVAGQAASVATASEEMAATSAEVAQNCTMAAEASRQANEKAVSGAAVVQETVQVMNRIAGRVKESARTVATLGVRSDQIGEIVETIEDIADQTNLLALNAAIEAARAGEQGRGFAVVADEVRALAERTTRATKEIAQMIKAIQQETQGAVASMEDGVREVESGTVKAAQSGEALQEILSRIDDVTVQINQIAVAAEQQTSTTNEISRNIQQITEVVNETARGALESADASSQLAGLASGLQRLVARFKLST